MWQRAAAKDKGLMHTGFEQGSSAGMQCTMLTHMLLCYIMRIIQDVAPEYELIFCATLQDQPQAEEAAETSGFDADAEASSEDDDSPAVSQDFHTENQDSGTSLDQLPVGGMQHGGSEGSKYANSRALLRAARLGRSEHLERLLNAGCTVDVQDADGFTPIYHAARGNQLASLNEPVARACLTGAS